MTNTIQDNFANPLNYFCAPNGTGPDYVAEHNFQRFIAFGMAMCYQHILGDGCENINGDTADVYWLRKNFLNTVQIALDALPDMIQNARSEKKRQVNYMGDLDQSAPIIPLKRDKWQGNSRDDNELPYQWSFERLDMQLASDDDDPCLLFILNWGENDDFAIWLRLDAVYGENRFKPTKAANANVRLVMDMAETWNEEHKGETTRPKYDDDGNIESA